jgi:hypothetical protein
MLEKYICLKCHHHFFPTKNLSVIRPFVTIPWISEEKSFLSARKADLKKGFQHLVVLVVVLVVGTRVKKTLLGC